MKTALVLLTALALSGCESGNGGGNCDASINDDWSSRGVPSRTTTSSGDGWNSLTNYWTTGGGSYIGARPVRTVAISYYWGSAFDGECDRIYSSY